MSYIKTEWVNGNLPALNADNLNKMEQGIFDANDSLGTILQRTKVSVTDFGALGDGINDDTQAIKDAIDEVELQGGGVVYFPRGIYMITNFFLKSNVLLVGESQDSVTIKQIIGTNTDMIASYDYATEDIYRSGLYNISLNGNYFTSAWNTAVGSYGNTLGGGIRVRGYGLIFKVGINNIAGIGALFEETHNSENSSEYHEIGYLDISGRDFGKEALILRGPNDWFIKQAFLGRAGILKRPEADTQISMSAYYSGEAVNAIVLDGINLEIGLVHVYANWSGCGFITKNTCRLTANKIISESNRSQVQLSAGTYGSASLDIRNLSLLHPNWSTTIPTYTATDIEWDGVTVDSTDIDLDITLKRTITAITRVVGTTAIVNNSSANIEFNFSNSTAPVGDTEAGQLYSGTVFRQNGDSAIIKAKIRSAFGNAFLLYGGSNIINASIYDSIGGSAFVRDSQGNSKRGNNINLSFEGCPIGFNSIGTPMAESLNLTYEYGSGGSSTIGDSPDLNRRQTWNISGSNANVGEGSFSTNNIDTKSISTDGLNVNANSASLAGNNFTAFNISTTTNDPYISLNQTTDGNNWSILNDSSDGNSLDFRFNNVQKMNLDSDGNLTVAGTAPGGGGGTGDNVIRINTTSPTASSSYQFIDISSYNLDYSKITSISSAIEGDVVVQANNHYVQAAYRHTIYINKSNDSIGMWVGNLALVNKPLIITITYTD